MRQVGLFVVFAVLLLIPSVSRAQFDCTQDQLKQGPKNAIIAKLEVRYEKLADLRADFSQESLFLGFNERIQSKGRVVFKKPGMMDWNYSTPETQRFVADGQNLWFFQPEMNQVTVGKFQQSFQSGLPVSFLLGLGSLSKDFKVTKACRSELGVVLELSPNISDPSLQLFKLIVDENSGLPKGALVVDIGGNETQIVFSNITTDQDISDSHFQFEIPKGVDVIDQRSKG